MWTVLRHCGSARLLRGPPRPPRSAAQKRSSTGLKRMGRKSPAAVQPSRMGRPQRSPFSFSPFAIGPSGAQVRKFDTRSGVSILPSFSSYVCLINGIFDQTISYLSLTRDKTSRAPCAGAERRTISWRKRPACFPCAVWSALTMWSGRSS